MHSQVKFFEFINKAQIQAAKRISSAMNSDTSATSKDGNNSSGDSREDFFHVIQAAKEAGIQEGDYCNIWSERQQL